MSLSNDQVGHIARLARIALSDTELDATRAKLNGIFELIEQMQARHPPAPRPRHRCRPPRGLPADRAADRGRPLPGAESHRMIRCAVRPTTCAERASPLATATPTCLPDK